MTVATGPRAGLLVLLAAACGGPAREAAEAAHPPGASAAEGGPRGAAGPGGAAPAADGTPAGGGPSATASAGPPPPAAPCPADMAHVRHAFCPDVERRCLKEEYDRANHITICHAFREGSTVCRAERRAVDVCVDRFEYPNREGGHPPVMVDFHDGERLCAAQGKRLCTEGEWTAACEGPDETPFPYGWRRSAEACNIDNRWIDPSLGAVYSQDPEVQRAELVRLDQSVPSGARAGCVSGFGVHDLTGNFDEWVRADRVRPRAKAKQAALKGGAWGHVRNACRPVTTSHEPEFRYYFVSFRCCADPAPSAGAGPAAPGGAPPTPPAQPVGAP